MSFWPLSGIDYKYFFGRSYLIRFKKKLLAKHLFAYPYSFAF